MKDPRTGLARLFLRAALVIVIGTLAVGSARAAAYYVDCSSVVNGTGALGSPWNNLATPTARTFVGGDTIYLYRGMTCSGQLWPKGSGSAASPITIDSYGTGPLPVVAGGASVDAAVKLYNQQGWHIQNIEVTGGNTYGVWIGGNAGALNHFRVTNVVVHNVTGAATSKNCGLVDVDADWGTSAVMGDVVIDGVTAYQTGQWNGIRIMCAGAMVFPGNPQVTIRNSTVHDVAGDGIVIFTCSNALIENTVAYNTGLIASDAIGTPNSTWTWSCKDCTVQYNEAYNAHSPGVDGGAFDIDYPDQNNVYQYNYAHDNDAYCIAVFGGVSGTMTLNNTIRYNVCANNARDATYDPTRTGEIYLTVWSRAKIQDTYIYNNTIYWNPSNPAYYAIVSNNVSHGSGINNSNFYNNVIYGTNPNMVKVQAFQAQTHMDYNLYYVRGFTTSQSGLTKAPKFVWGSTTYTGLPAFRAGAVQEAHGMNVDPLFKEPSAYHGIGMPGSSYFLRAGSPAINAGANLSTLGMVPSMGARDFFGNPIPSGAFDLGAFEAP